MECENETRCKAKLIPFDCDVRSGLPLRWFVERVYIHISYALYIINCMSRPFSNWDVYKAIADPNRRIVLDLLMRGDHTVSALQMRIQLTQPALSQHLKVLREVGLVRQRRNGRERIYSLNPKPLREMSDWVQHYEAFWEKKLTALGEHLDRRAAQKRSAQK